MNGKVVAICISPAAGEPMQHVQEVQAIAGQGLEGDRYCKGEGSYNKGAQGKRQVTLINGMFVAQTPFLFNETRRNIIIDGVELMWLIGREFQIGVAKFRGVKYCDPCEVPSQLLGVRTSFKKTFFDRGGLIAEVIEGGLIKVGDAIIPPPKRY